MATSDLQNNFEAKKFTSTTNTITILLFICVFSVVSQFLVAYFFLEINNPLKSYNRISDYLIGELNKDEKIYRGISFHQKHGKLIEIPSYIPDIEKQEKETFKSYVGGFNKGLSDVTSLNRIPPDQRDQFCKDVDYTGIELPKATVVIIFCNEVFSILMRSVHSVLNLTPKSLLAEILLVADSCSSTQDQSKMINEINKHIKQLPKVRLIASKTRLGIVNARLLGIENVNSEVFVILDSHIEANEGWLEPILATLKEKPEAIVIPKIGGIIGDTLELSPHGVGCTIGIIWNLMEHGFNRDNEYGPTLNHTLQSGAIFSPTMTGGLFAANKKSFYDIGSYDPNLSFWGAENLELSFRAWQCGGAIACHPCSLVYHMFRTGGPSPYKVDPTSYLTNKLRIMDAWMDEYGDITWNFIGRPTHIDYGDMEERKSFREKKKCHSFKWFLENIWPESQIADITTDLPNLGKIINYDKDYCLIYRHQKDFHFAISIAKCANSISEYFYFKRTKQIRPIHNSEACLTLGEHNTLFIEYCRENTIEKSQRWEYTSDLQLKNEKTNKCISKLDSSYEMETCDQSDINQKWHWDDYTPTMLWKK